ncbi:MAG TPA: RecT family recombinase [Polyangia bacterium]|nr:RecT family recombinase [Polyangia bacterium]
MALRNDGASAIIESYKADLAAIMPSHMKPDVFTRLAVAVLSRDQDLLRAAQNNPASLMTALWEASRLGLEPGTEQYYLTWRKTKNGPEIVGMEGYQGEIELIYRAGAVTSVTVEVVREKDVFIWEKGTIDRHDPPRWDGPQKQPYHGADWFEDRGALKGVYAYADMKGGSISEVIVLNRFDIAEAKTYAKGADEAWSPWRKSEKAMWLKTAAHRLRKWVPTSSEYMREQLRAITEVQSERDALSAAAPARRAAAPIDRRGVEDFRAMADDAAGLDELTVALGEAQGAGFAQQGDELFQHFLARRSAITARGVEVVDAHAHEGDWDPDCAACKAESAAHDRAAA